MSLASTFDDKMILKFNIIKQGLIAEKSKNAKLQKENNWLKEDLQMQNELLLKLKHELNQIKTTSEKKPAKSIFNVLFLSGDEEGLSDPNDNQISKLLQENKDLKSQLLLANKEKEFITSKLNEQIKEYEVLKISSSAELEKLKLHYHHDLYNRNNKDNEQDDNHYLERINAMSAMISRINNEKSEGDKLIEYYEKDQNNKINNICLLYLEQNMLLEEIDELKNEINKLQKENDDYCDYIDTLVPISRKTVFKGKRIMNEEEGIKRDIWVTFGEKQNSIIFREEGEKIEARMLNVKKMECVETNKISFSVFCKENEVKYFIEFRPKHIEYIIKYYDDAQAKTDIIEHSLLNYTFDPCY